MMEEIIEEHILIEIRNSNINALKSFFQNSHARLLAYANLFLHDIDIAEDLVQEAFINLWDKRSTLKVGKSIESLIFTSVRNRCLNYLRDEDVYRQHINNLEVEKTELQHLAQYDFLGYEEEVLEEILLKELRVCIDELPPKCRQVFIMNKFEDKTQKDIAKELNISLKAVEKHMHNAKIKLQENLTIKFPTLGIFIVFFINN